MKRLALLLLTALFIPACGDPVAAPTPEQIPVPGSTEYPHTMVKESVFDAGTGKEYRLYEPDGPPLLSAPVVVFLHGWGGTDPAYYRPWIDHLARRGNLVLWVRYQESVLTLPSDFVPNMLAAVKAGLARLEQDADRPKPELDKLAVVGHSMGGVLSMTLAARAAGEGLPPFKAVMLANPGRGVTGPEVLADYSLIPASTLLVGVSGAEDTLGTDAPFFFYQATQVPLDNKDHILMNSDYHSTPSLVADHFAPNCLTAADVNALDVNGYWKWFDGLSAAAFYGRYREYALGNTAEQRFMGLWPDGTPIAEPTVSDAP
ncbi:MAG TPA: alpha/beta hydrolase [Planctomycetota bacterium]|nr:alpha/beta hydrolase [Planctomycetota bacterium]